MDDPNPIYEQIESQLREFILAGVLPPGTKLPSVRALSSYLGCSVLTARRAYEDLEREGFILTRQGMGSVVADIPEEKMAAHRREPFERAIGEAVGAGRRAGLPEEELREIIEDDAAVRRHQRRGRHVMKGRPLRSPVISLENVRKSHKGGFHLGPVDLAIEPGRIVAVVGPNGGGKSTLFGMLMNLLRPDSGTVSLFGLAHPRDEVAIKQRIGYVPELATGRDDMSARYLGDFVSYWYPNRSSSLSPSMNSHVSSPSAS